MKIYRKNRTQYAQLFMFKQGAKLLFLIGCYNNVEHFEDLKGNVFEVIGRNETKER